MDDYTKLVKLTSDDKVELATHFRDSLHKELFLGQTRWVCRYGTLSDGHEKITNSQKYYQSIKEMWYLRSNMVQMKASAMIAQADALEAKEKLELAATEADKLRYTGQALRAEETVLQCLTTVEDQMRLLDEYNKIRLELKDEVLDKYPEGAEQAELDNWTAVYRYRKVKGGVSQTSNIPLPPEVKASLGVEYHCAESVAPLFVTDKDRYIALERKLMAAKDNVRKLNG